MKYTIECSEEQLGLISQACELMARLIVGQVDKLDDICFDAIRRHRTNGKSTDSTWDIRDKVDELLDQIHKECWGQRSNEFYGVKYSPKSDMLFDIYEVIRYELWKNTPKEKRSEYTVDSRPAFQWNKEKSLIKVEKNGTQNNA